MSPPTVPPLRGKAGCPTCKSALRLEERKGDKAKVRCQGAGCTWVGDGKFVPGAGWIAWTVRGRWLGRV